MWPCAPFTGDKCMKMTRRTGGQWQRREARKRQRQNMAVRFCREQGLLSLLLFLAQHLVQSWRNHEIWELLETIQTWNGDSLSVNTFVCAVDQRCSYFLLTKADNSWLPLLSLANYLFLMEFRKDFYNVHWFLVLNFLDHWWPAKFLQSAVFFDHLSSTSHLMSNYCTF